MTPTLGPLSLSGTHGRDAGWEVCTAAGEARLGTAGRRCPDIPTGWAQSQGSGSQTGVIWQCRGGYCLYWEEARGATKRPTGHRAAHQEPTQNAPAHSLRHPREVPGGALREHGAMTPTGSCLCGRLSWPPPGWLCALQSGLSLTMRTQLGHHHGSCSCSVRSRDQAPQRADGTPDPRVSRGLCGGGDPGSSAHP